VGVSSAVFGDDAAILRDQSFQLLFLANLLPPLGTALLSPVLNSLIGPLGATTANVGLMMSAFTAPPILLIPVVGVVADRYGRRPVIIAGLLVFGAAGTAIAFTESFRVALVLRMLQGVGFAGLTPVIITSIGDLYSGTAEATAQGLRFTGSGLSQTVSPLLAGVLVGIAWQYPFLVYAIAFPVAVVIYGWFEEPVDAAAETDGADRTVRAQLGELRELVAHRRAWGMVVARGMPNTVWLGFLTYNSIVVTDLLGGTPTQAGLLAALGSISYALSATQVGRISAFFDSRFYPLVAMNVAMGAGLALVFLGDTFVLALGGAVVMGAGFGLSISLYRTIITNLAPPSLRGGFVSLAEGGGRLTSTLTPIVMGAGIGVASTTIGYEPAVRAVGVAVGVVAAGLAIAALAVVHTAPEIQLST
jgi:MFS family permease